MMMATSDRLCKVVELIRTAQQEARRLAVDLPQGQTLELLEVTTERDLRLSISRLEEEAAQLRQRFRD